MLSFAAVFLVVSSASPAPLAVRVQPGTAKPGDAVLITVYGRENSAEGTLGEWRLTFVPFEKGHQALIGLPTETPLGALELKLRVKNGEKENAYDLAIDVVDPAFRHDELKVAKKFTSPSKAQKKRVQEDQRAFDAAFSQPLVARLFQRQFEWPKLAPLSAPFGDLRMFNGKRQSQHYGLDIDGETGDPVFASNDGQVVMARDCFGSGNTILIHHGAGLYTAYFHLSAMEKKLHQKVKQGDRIGRVGKTGRVTGPHLHWGVKIDGRWVDGRSLLALDFE